MFRIAQKLETRVNLLLNGTDVLLNFMPGLTETVDQTIFIVNIVCSVKQMCKIPFYSSVTFSVTQLNLPLFRFESALARSSLKTTSTG